MIEEIMLGKDRLVVNIEYIFNKIKNKEIKDWYKMIECFVLYILIMLK